MAKCEFLKIPGSNLYCKKLELLNEMFSEFAMENNFPYPDMARTFNGSDFSYFTINSEDNSIKFIVSTEKDKESAVKEWKDPDVINTFMAFYRLYTYYTGVENKD